MTWGPSIELRYQWSKGRWETLPAFVATYHRSRCNHWTEERAPWNGLPALASLYGCLGADEIAVYIYPSPGIPAGAGPDDYLAAVFADLQTLHDLMPWVGGQAFVIKPGPVPHEDTWTLFREWAPG